jgi:tetratricopeptide (TPR) repeat protein
VAGQEQHPHPIPNVALDAFDLGARAYVTGNNDEALVHFERAIASHADFSDAFYMQALALFRADRKAEAIASMEKAAELTGNPLLEDYARRRIAQESRPEIAVEAE